MDLLFLVLEVATFSRRGSATYGQDVGIKVKSWEGGRNPLIQSQRVLDKTHKQNEQFLKHSESQDSAKT